MLISRVASKESSPALSTGSEPASTLGSRKESLKHLWQVLQDQIYDASTEMGLLERLDCDVLDEFGDDWIPSVVTFREDGIMRLQRKIDDQTMAMVRLPQSTIIGRLGRSYIQVTSDDAQSFLIATDTTHFSRLCYTLFAWSRLRPAGVDKKLWCPPIEKLSHPEADLLKCAVKAHTIASPELAWTQCLARLKRSGDLQLFNRRDECIFRLQVRDVLSSRLRRVDPSIVDSDMVLLLFPDLGGPESVYLKFADIDDFEDWFATLRSLSQQPVAAPLDRNPLKSVRWEKSLAISVSSCQLDKGICDPFMDLKGTYVDISVSGWVCARTFLNFDPDAAAWGQKFEIRGPELSSRLGSLMPSEVVLKLRRLYLLDAPGASDNDITIATVSPEYFDEPNSWQWHTLKPGLSLNASIQAQEIAVLDASYYASLSDVVSDLSLRTANKLAQASPTSSLRQVSLFSDIYRSHGRQNEWVLGLISDEVQTLDPNSTTLFRGNSLLTRALEALLQQNGSELLHRTIGRFVRKLGSRPDTSFELNPARLGNAHQDVIQMQISMAYDYLRYLWKVIRSEELPLAFRRVFGHMRHELKERKLPEADVDAIMNRTLAAFLFLRFYSPALLNPQLFNLTDRMLGPSHRRTVILVAKILQGFANRVKFGSKEEWLVPMNVFIEDHEDELVKWYANISGEETIEETAPSTIRKVRSDSVTSQASLMSGDKAPKELPVETYMNNQLTSPNLVDEWATFAKLAELVTRLESTDSLFATLAAADPVLSDLLLRSREVVRKTEEIVESLSKPDTIADASSMSDTKIYLNHTTMLYGTDASQLEPYEPRELPRSQASQSRFGWFSSRNSGSNGTSGASSGSNGGGDARTNQRGGNERPPPKTSSVRKLTQMLKLSKSSH